MSIYESACYLGVVTRLGLSASASHLGAFMRNEAVSQVITIAAFAFVLASLEAVPTALRDQFAEFHQDLAPSIDRRLPFAVMARG